MQKTEFSNRKAEADRPLRLPGPQGAAGRSALHRVSSFAALGTPGASQSLFNGRGQSLFNNAKTARPIGRAAFEWQREKDSSYPAEQALAGAPFHLTASVAAQSGSLRQDGGARRRVRIHAALR